MRMLFIKSCVDINLIGHVRVAGACQTLILSVRSSNYLTLAIRFKFLLIDFGG